MHVLTLASQKGGSGKTSLAASLAVAAAEAGETVAAVDTDPQGSLAAWGRRRQAEGITVEAAEPARVRVGRPDRPGGQPVDRRGAAGPHPGTGTTDLLVDAWAGPWPIDELWWDPQAARQVARFQVVAVDGSAWLLLVEDGRWWVEARYE